MESTKSIEHKGVIKLVKDNILEVNIIAESACASCHVKNVCSVADRVEKTIEVKNTRQQHFQIGEIVIVYYRQSLGFTALFLGYIMPLILLLAGIFITASITKNEAIIGLVSVFVLFPYYAGLYFFRRKIKNKFTFSVAKI